MYKPLLLTLIASLISQANATTAIRIGSERQLFIGPWTEDGRDSHLVASMNNVTMTAHEARVTGERLIELDKPWEGTHLVDPRFTILKDGDLFRMYYCTMPIYPENEKDLHQRIVCYAESADGIHWTKPNLGLWSWNGSRDNNIILPNDDFKYAFREAEGCWVFIDSHTDRSDEKYKMLLKMVSFEETGDNPEILPWGQHLFTSPDGIHWKLKRPKTINPGAADAKFSMFWDDRISQYVLYTRMKHRGKFGSFRFIGRATSEDLYNWGEEAPVIVPDEIDLMGSIPDLPRVDIYDPHVVKYTEASNVYLAFANNFYHWKIDKKGRKGACPGTMDVQLVTSRDGIHWNRTPQRRPFIRLGTQDTFWNRAIWPNGYAIQVGDELWIYLAGWDVAHNWEQKNLKSGQSRGTYTRAVLRLDGFISADTKYTGGELTTNPLIFSGKKLQLNGDTSAGGTVKVEIQDESGSPIDGFTAEEADEINGNYIRVSATWNDTNDVSPLAGKPIRLRFIMRDARLYSFQFLP
ncbi:MAG: hypothetical protein ABIH23_25020 [bacterium]